MNMICYLIGFCAGFVAGAAALALSMVMAREVRAERRRRESRVDVVEAPYCAVCKESDCEECQENSR